MRVRNSFERPPHCPVCSSQHIAFIAYGIVPDYNCSRLQADLKMGRVILGGGFFTKEYPAWCCRGCGYEIRRDTYQGPLILDELENELEGLKPWSAGPPDEDD